MIVALDNATRVFPGWDLNSVPFIKTPAHFHIHVTFDVLSEHLYISVLCGVLTTMCQTEVWLDGLARLGDPTRCAVRNVAFIAEYGTVDTVQTTSNCHIASSNRYCRQISC